MKKIINEIFCFLVRPFTKELYFLLLLLLLVSSADVIGYICYGRLIFAGILGLHGYFMCYIITLISTVLPTRWNKAYKIIFIILAYVNFFIDVAVHTASKTNFTEDMVAIIYGTNVSESKEFISTYVSYTLLILLFLGILATMILKLYSCRLNKIGNSNYIKVPFLLFTILSCTYLSKADTVHWEGIFLGKIVTFLSYELPPDLSQYLSKTDVQVDGDLPDNIVLIIGESFSKYHSSLYGYTKETNPKLGKMAKDSELVIYTDVESSSTTTINSIIATFSGADMNVEDHSEWYKNTTLLEIMSLAGYETIWISNQSPSGVYDNVISQYARLCDTSLFVGSKYRGGGARVEYDEEVLKHLIRVGAASKDVDKRFFIIHLMGSHPAFIERFPSSYSYFKEEDYNNMTEYQRKRIAEYDNSILYNDDVVAAIFDYLKAYEAIAFYFSDHGLDVFYGSEKHIGHARTNIPLSVKMAKQIPFIVYLSPSFKENKMNISNEVLMKSEEYFCTIDLMPYMLNLFNIKCDTNSGILEDK